MKSVRKHMLITGAAGFIGQHISRYFSNKGWIVVGIDKLDSTSMPIGSLASYYQIKLPDSSFHSVLRSNSFDLCIHCAGGASVSMSVDDPGTDFHSNTVITFELLNALRLYSPECRFVYLSSAAVYGNPDFQPIDEIKTKACPVSPYGFHKFQGEQICAEFSSIYGIQTAVARVFSAYGTGLRRQVIWDIIQKALTSSEIVLQGNGTESRDFIHVSDIAYAIDSIVENAVMEGEAFNVANGIEVSIRDLANLIISNLSFHVSIEFDGKVPKGVPLNWCSNISKLKSLGFSPKITLDDGIKRFTKWALIELDS